MSQDETNGFSLYEEEPILVGDSPPGEFRVTYSDGSNFVFEAEDEASALAQANGSYTGPAIIVGVEPRTGG